jgi:imidazolonepropionase-like amidohydrolase
MSRVFLSAFLLALCFVAPVAAQQPVDPGVRPVTRTFAITNARVYQAPGQVLERATVIVRDGRIEAVGANVRAPFDAEIIEGDSLFVYAGFIDTLSFAGLSFPAIDTNERVPVPDTPPRARAGILPERRAIDHLDATAAGIEGLRRAGFTVAHVAPSSGMLPGQGAVILLSGKAAEEVALRPVGGLVARWQGASGVRPATPMGVAAMFRQLYRRSGEAAEVQQRFGRDAAAMRPTFDPALDALQASRSGDQPVYFVVSDLPEAQRALALGDELGLRIVLAGVPEAPLLADRLARSRRHVVLPLILPKAIEVDTTDTRDPDQLLADHISGEIFRTERRIVSYRDVPEEPQTFNDRRRAALMRTERNARTLHAAGVPLTFGTLDAPAGELRATLRRIVEAGLPADAALAALTTTPAELLGIGNVAGTVEAGRLANLVLTDGDYFGEGTRVRYVFVEGQRFEIEQQTAAAGDPDAVVNAPGRWSFTINTPDGAYSGTMTVDGAADALTGSMNVTGLGNLSMRDLRLVGNRLTALIPDTPGGPANLSVIISDDSMTGELTVPGLGSVPFTANRQPG